MKGDCVYMYKTYNVDCPTQCKEFEVDVKYIESRVLEDNVKRYNRGRIECSYLKNGGSCNNPCPALKVAPETI